MKYLCMRFCGAMSSRATKSEFFFTVLLFEFSLRRRHNNQIEIYLSDKHTILWHQSRGKLKSHIESLAISI